MADMPRKPFLSHEKTRHDRWVWYFKRHGKRVRLPDEYGTPQFNAAYERALTGSSASPEPLKPKTGTFKWLVGQYKRSAAFSALAPLTRQARDNMLIAVLKDPKVAEMPYGAISRANIKKGIDKRAATPNAANNFLKTMSHLFKWAVEAKHLETNPVSGVSKVTIKTDGFHAWSVEQVEKYRAHHKLGTKPRLAIDIMLFLGLRRSDPW